MYCARCGETVPARALVCKQCGNNLTRAGAIRMTAGALSTHENADVAGLGLPDDIFVRYRRDEDVPTRMIPAVPDEPDTGPDLEAEADNADPDPEPAPPAPPARPSGRTTARPAALEEEGMSRHRWIAIALATVMVLAAMGLVLFLALKLMNPLPPVDATPGPSSATPAASTKPSAAPTSARPTPTTTKPTSQAPKTTAAPKLPDGVKECSATVGADGNASCPFALAVDQKTKGQKGTFTAQVFSPTSKREFRVNCAPQDGLTRCTSGNAIIWLRR